MSFIKLTDLDLTGKRVLIRSDLNVPVKDGKVTSDAGEADSPRPSWRRSRASCSRACRMASSSSVTRRLRLVIQPSCSRSASIRAA